MGGEKLFFSTKQKKQAKRKGRSKWRQLFSLFFIVILLALFSYGSHWIYLHTKPSSAPINHVKIFASFEHLDRTTVQNIIDPYLHNGFYYLNVIGLRHQLLHLPWVAKAAIQREWPDTIVIGISEQQAVARWGNVALFNNQGVMFFPPPASFPLNLPLLLGPPDQANMVFREYLQMSKILASSNSIITEASVSPQHFWRIVLSTGTVLFLDEKTPEKQLISLLKVYPRIILDHDKPPLSIDLRYKNGFAVKWADDDKAM
jgi:cell division protein FtsQ